MNTECTFQASLSKWNKYQRLLCRANIKWNKHISGLRSWTLQNLLTDRHWITCATPSYPSPRPCGPPWPWTVMKINHNQLTGNEPRPMGQLRDRSRQLDQGVNIYTRAGSNMRQEEKSFCAQKIFRLLLKRSESWLNIRHASTSTVEPPRWQQDTNNMVQMWEACCFFKN